MVALPCRYQSSSLCPLQSEGGSELDSDEEEGKDWDELESEAARADKMREDLEEAEERHAGGKRKGAPKAAPAKRRR